MFAVGMLALLQMAFFPGYLLLLAARIERRSSVETFVYALPLSVLANYVLACAATMLGIWVTPTAWAIVALELAALAVLRGRCALPGMPDPRRAGAAFRASPWLNRVVLALAVAALALFLKHWLKNVGAVFGHPDEIGSYNNWAQQWTRNRMPDPIDTMGYPIAIPANWSLTYLLLRNDEVQFFNTLLTGLFPLALVLGLFDLGRRLRSMVPFLTAACFAFVVQCNLGKNHIGQGPLDLPAACVAFSAVYAVLVAGAPRPPTWRLVALVHLLAASSALLKQAGLMAVGGAAIWTVWALAPRLRRPTRAELAKCAAAAAVGVVLALSWYAWIRYLIHEGRSVSESAYLMKGIHAGRSYAERYFNASTAFFGGGKYVNTWLEPIARVGMTAICALATASVIARPLARTLFLGLVVPYFVAWAFLFSYELRTFAFALPALAFCGATGFYWLVEKRWPGLSRFVVPPPLAPPPRSPSRRFLAATAGGLVLLAAVGGTLAFPEDRLRARQSRLQRQVLMPELNEKLYEHYEREGYTGRIASQYGILRYLPGIKAHFFPVRLPITLDLLKNLEEREEIHYLLLLDTRSVDSVYGFRFIDEASAAWIAESIRTGRYGVVFALGEIRLLKIVR